MSKVTWGDLFTDDPSLDIGKLLVLWPGTVAGRVRPIGMSAFGDIYFERPGGQIERLDVLEGGITRVASTQDEFSKLMNTRTWQEENLLSEGVALLAERGLNRQPQQCFAFVPHPVISGKIEWSRVMLMDAFPWHSICSQLLDVFRKDEHAT
jgi:hypothetical protein